jgi:hypothetical protein
MARRLTLVNLGLGGVEAEVADVEGTRLCQKAALGIAVMLREG